MGTSSDRKLETKTNQIGPHPDLHDVLARHFERPYRRPIAEHTQSAFDSLIRQINFQNTPIVFDSGCGTGESSILIKRSHPEATVIGIDRSEVRLLKGHQKIESPESGVILIRAELADFWRLALQNKLLPSHHYILYPNPYPKKQHLKRRWHAHPVFPALLALGGDLILRSDWRIYIDEFRECLSASGIQSNPLRCINSEENPITPFEAKYLAQNRTLYELRTCLPRQND